MATRGDSVWMNSASSRSLRGHRLGWRNQVNIAKRASVRSADCPPPDPLSPLYRGSRYSRSRTGSRLVSAGQTASSEVERARAAITSENRSRGVILRLGRKRNRVGSERDLDEESRVDHRVLKLVDEARAVARKVDKFPHDAAFGVELILENQLILPDCNALDRLAAITSGFEPARAVSDDIGRVHSGAVIEHRRVDRPDVRDRRDLAFIRAPPPQSRRAFRARAAGYGHPRK